MPSQSLRIAVVGAGHLGRWHAQQLAGLSGIELVAICDPDPSRKTLADLYGCRWVPRHEDLEAGAVDGVTIAAPTTLHHRLATHFLEQRIPCLVEKPMAATAAEARSLCELAERQQTLLQVGHIERFNPALRAVTRKIANPRFLEAVRVAPYPFRATDVGVVLDLMIHDLEIILALVRDEIVEVRAWATPVFSSTEDLAAAWIEFRGGACAQLKAVRTALRTERRLRIYQPDAFIEVDFMDRIATVTRRDPRLESGEIKPEALTPQDLGGLSPTDFVQNNLVSVEKPPVDPDANPLRDELAAFARCIREGVAPQVGGRDGLRAMEAAEMVRKAAGLP
ncbi:MAG TPA: Gfo/Idh/MocA family oxidoreductase [Candidatus Krumholzibacteria bacterium]|nr:Gfo/Idh/MocA family oxidoreductase [Candidatus Krumholzibacteria bacterium]HPD72232.1 Gfo/Idh/MocA family oxidoreductase [Candidatus Krumholzibacteria bacterium]HRY40836.1 Gfo/Idh/MocA family oxidoreductase [Candidatus Krumholzibacteria bacterium]